MYTEAATYRQDLSYVAGEVRSASSSSTINLRPISLDDLKPHAGSQGITRQYEMPGVFRDSAIG